MSNNSGIRGTDALVRGLVRAYRRVPFRLPRLGLDTLHRSYVLRHSGRTVVATIDGVTYELDLNEMIDSSLYFQGSWEHRATSTIARLVRPGMTVLDVGANIGYFTLAFAKMVGATGHVLAFEPTTWAHEKLRRNIGLNAFANIVVEKLALSDISEIREITPNERAFQASWAFSGDPGRQGNESVKFLPLDYYIRDANIASVDFIKIDVDGNEYRVVLGAVETLRSFQPPVLLEIGKATMNQVGDRPEDLVALLCELEYVFYTEDSRRCFSSGAEVLEWIPYQGANVLCLPTGDLPGRPRERAVT